MKTVQKLSALAVLLVLASCNEKVSPELQNSGVVAPTPPPSANDTVYSFKVVNKAADVLNYQLHKVGLNNASAACEITSTNTPLTHANFGAASDITCFLEAEELSLYSNGLSMEVQANPNTCEFIRYSPFSFYNRQPGDSTGTYKQITCTNEDTTNAHVAQVVTGLGYDPDGTGPLTDVGNDIGCNEWASENPLLKSGPTYLRNKFTVANELDANTLESDQALCRFNYTDGDLEKCDVGTITVENYQVTWDKAKAEAAGAIAGDADGDAAASPFIVTYTDGSDDDGAGPDDGLPAISAGEQAGIDAAYNAAYTPTFNATVAAYPPTVKKVTRKVKCGGKAANCVAGPIKSHAQLTGTRGGFISTLEKGKAYTSKYEYPSLLPTRWGTYIYANYRRNLANSLIDYISTTDPFYDTAFIDNKTYDPLIMDRYAKNKTYDGLLTVIGGATDVEDLANYAIEDLTFSALPLAAEPFLGIGSANQTNPFYMYECLDTAQELKARIRIVVRDWDRIFPAPDPITGLNSPDMELLTDIYKTAPADLARQDISSDDGDDGNFNDYWDWDNMFHMDKQDAPFPLIYRPNLGFFDKDNFPNEDLE